VESIAIDDDRDHPAHARKAAVDGMIAVCRDAGGRASTLGAFALVPDVRSIFFSMARSFSADRSRPDSSSVIPPLRLPALCFALAFVNQTNERLVFMPIFVLEEQHGRSRGLWS